MSCCVPQASTWATLRVCPSLLLRAFASRPLPPTLGVFGCHVYSQQSNILTRGPQLQQFMLLLCLGNSCKQLVLPTQAGSFFGYSTNSMCCSQGMQSRKGLLTAWQQPLTESWLCATLFPLLANKPLGLSHCPPPSLPSSALPLACPLHVHLVSSVTWQGSSNILIPCQGSS